MRHGRDSSSDSGTWRDSVAWSSSPLSMSAKPATNHAAGADSHVSSPPLTGSARATLGQGSMATTSPPLSSPAHATSSERPSTERKSPSDIVAIGHIPMHTPALGLHSSPSLPLSIMAVTGQDVPPVLSPEEMTQEELGAPEQESPSSQSSKSSAHSSGRRLPGGNVASRVQAYERRMSLDAETSTSPPPRNTRKREERSHGRPITVNYGLVQRPSLFVANPDDRHSSRGSSDSSLYQS